MSYLAKFPFGMLTGAILAWALTYPGSVPKGQAQERKLPEKRKFNATTADGVRLVGDFYPSPKGHNGPTIMLLHAIGRSATKDALSRKNFAPAFIEELQALGYAVLTFDFRGYGESTQVEMKFWDSNPLKLPVNRANPPTSIESSKFTLAQHFLTMGNDLTAAKEWLNLANNSRECNSAALVLVACEETAMLALAWAYCEHLDPARRKDPTNPTSEQQGKDIVAFIFLSFRDSLNGVGQSIRLPGWFQKCPSLRDTPMANIVSAEDAAGQNSWKRVLPYIRPENLKAKYEARGMGITHVVKSKLVGHRLLTGVANFKAEEWIDSYLTKHLPGDRVWRQQPQVGNVAEFNFRLLGF
ncbi:MAG: hypothetical protein RMI91_10060 [Gemmatales bacterium]|nr:hypothetical protein [Gemmatales bacterium]MDW7994985.1 hypothetical protein [Gemmatales bacterium]